MRDYGPPIAPPSFEDFRTNASNQRTRYNRKLRVWNVTGGYCFYCECALVFDGVNSFHMDHVRALSCGGPDMPANKVPACEQCNRSKHNHNAFSWARERGFDRAAATLMAMGAAE